MPMPSDQRTKPSQVPSRSRRCGAKVAFSPIGMVADTGGMRLARLHGYFNLLTGLWAPLHRRSFEAVTGPKVDYWLVNSVAGLLITNGLVQLTAPVTPDGQAMARRLGIGTAGALTMIDVVY